MLKYIGLIVYKNIFLRVEEAQLNFCLDVNLRQILSRKDLH